MARTPYPLLDPIMVGPVLLCLNIHFSLLPELLLMSLVVVSSASALHLPSLLSSTQVYAVFDVAQTCMMSIRQICFFLDISCFLVPAAQISCQHGTTEPPESTPQTVGSHTE